MYTKWNFIGGVCMTFLLYDIFQINIIPSFWTFKWIWVIPNTQLETVLPIIWTRSSTLELTSLSQQIDRFPSTSDFFKLQWNYRTKGTIELYICFMPKNYDNLLGMGLVSKWRSSFHFHLRSIWPPNPQLKACNWSSEPIQTLLKFS